MFDGIKRMKFVVKSGPEYFRLYGAQITQVQVEIAQAGWPVNDFIDWFIAANSPTMSFCEYMNWMWRWVILELPPGFRLPSRCG